LILQTLSSLMVHTLFSKISSPTVSNGPCFTSVYHKIQYSLPLIIVTNCCYTSEQFSLYSEDAHT
jgi:hypothetical protein